MKDAAERKEGKLGRLKGRGAEERVGGSEASGASMRPTACGSAPGEAINENGDVVGSPQAERPARVGEGDKDRDMTVMVIGEADAPFILGKQGKTKLKLGRVSNCRVVLKDNTTLEIFGLPQDRARAEVYVKLIMKQRQGTVTIDFDPSVDRDDCTCVDVPKPCVAFVTGGQGFVLRTIEEEWGTLMFFVKKVGDPPERPFERLLIFGKERGRTGAQLKVMSAIEQKAPGHFTGGLAEMVSGEDGFDTDTLKISDEDFSYALGKDGSTRRKLARASGSIIEYIGKMAFFAGSKAERQRGKDYFSWLIGQRTHTLAAPVVDDRDDVAVVAVPKTCVRGISGPRGAYLRRLEEMTDSFCFLSSKGGADGASEDLFIFSSSEASRRDAKSIVAEEVALMTAGGRESHRWRAEGPYAENRRANEHWRRDDRGRDDRGRDDRGRDDRGRDDRGRDDRRRDDRGRDDRGRGDSGRDDRGRDDRGRGDSGGGRLERDGSWYGRKSEGGRDPSAVDRGSRYDSRSNCQPPRHSDDARRHGGNGADERRGSSAGRNRSRSPYRRRYSDDRRDERRADRRH